MVALAVVLRLTVLPGYMIAAAPSTVAVVMCTAGGAISQSVDLDPGQSTPDGGGDEHSGEASVCPFALAGVTLAASEARIDIVAPRPAPPRALPAPTGLPGQGLAAPPPPPTGPPFSV